MKPTLPKVLAEYLDTHAGRVMLEGATWFRWNLRTRKVESSGNRMTLPPAKVAAKDTLVFVRDGDGWKRYA